MSKPFKSKAMAALHENMRDLHKAGVIDDTRMRDYDDTCLATRSGDKTGRRTQPGTKIPSAGLSFSLFKDAKGEWRWQLVAANGKVIASSGEGYKSRAACVAGINLVKRSGDAPIAA